MIRNPITTSTNPGTVNPSERGFPPPPTLTAPPSTIPLRCSSGESQFPAALPTRPSGSPVLGLPAEVCVANGSCVVHSPPAPAQVTGVGLPSQVDAGAAGHTRPVPAAVATALPPTVNVDANTSLPCGLPKNVYVR